MTSAQVKRPMAEHIRSLGGQATEKDTIRDLAKAAREVGLTVQRGTLR